MVAPSEQEKAHLVPTKGFLQLSPEAAMLFPPFGCTHLPPLCPSLSAGAEAISKIVWCIYASIVYNRLRQTVDFEGGVCQWEGQ